MSTETNTPTPGNETTGREAGVYTGRDLAVVVLRNMLLSAEQHEPTEVVVDYEGALLSLSSVDAIRRPLNGAPFSPALVATGTLATEQGASNVGVYFEATNQPLDETMVVFDPAVEA